MCIVTFTDYTAEKVRTLWRSASGLRTQWVDPAQRADIIQQLPERGIAFDEPAQTASQPDTDPFDLLCHVAFNAPIRSRLERPDRLLREEKDFYDHYGRQGRSPASSADWTRSVEPAIGCNHYCMPHKVQRIAISYLKSEI